MPVRFNGAMTLRSWRGRLVPTMACGATALQWGHDLAVMESPRDYRGHAYSQPRFNGAMTLRSWRDVFWHPDPAATPQLQWGHDLAVMERGSARTRPATGDNASMGP